MSKSHAGFTFIEVALSLAIVGVISALSISMLLQGSEIFMGAKDDNRLMDEARSAIWRISRDSHNLASSHLLELSKSDRIYLKNAKNKQVDFSLSGSYININRNQQQNVLSEFLDNTTGNDINYLTIANDTINNATALSSENASSVNLLRFDFKFSKESQVLILGTHVYPYGFKFGKKMSYHD
jgi:prepilin-type N-terminal cleavage/methylation domain-containing protein